MRAPPRHRPRSHKPLQTREETVRIPDLRPRMVLAPLVLLVLTLVMVGFAVVVALALGTTAVLADTGASAWWVLPVAVGAVLSFSLHRDTRA